MNLSKNFTLSELSKTSTGIANTPPASAVENLKALCEHILQPLRDHLGKSITVNSGYRSPAVNKAVGGSATSHHMCNEYYAAADIVVSGMTPKEVYEVIRALNLPYEQVIQEPTWVHVSIRRPKKEAFVLK